MKKILATLIALSLTFGSLALPATESGISLGDVFSASAETYSYGYFDYEILEDGNIEISDYSGDDGNVVIPDIIDGKKVTSIGDGAFEGTYNWETHTYESNIISVKIPNGVINIGHRAFSDCINLKSITIPDSITSIGNDAFKGTAWLKNRQNENPLVIVNGILIDGSTAEGDVVIPNKVTSIGIGAFSNCSNLTSIKIPNSVTSISDSAFSYCSNLKNITLPNNITSIGDDTFFDCINLTNITLPDSVISIGINAFSGCSNLKNITIPNSVTSIGYNAFSYCSSLENINIPNSVLSIGRNAFSDCSRLKSIVMSNNLEFINYCIFMNCSNLKEIVIPDGVTEIGYGAFSGCTSLTNIIIPNSVTIIGMSTFSNCVSLKDVYYKGSTDDWANINIANYSNEYLTNANIHYNYDPNHTHSYTSSITKQPTCTAEGIKTFKCDCGDTYTETIPAKGHTEVIDVAVPATCTTDGKTEGSHCSVCGEVIKAQTVIKATGHKYDDGKITKQPTCTETGVKTFTCSECGTTKTETIKAKGHSYKTTIVAPTYDTEGYTLYKCSTCGNSYKDKITPKKTVGKATANGFSCSSGSVNFKWNKIDDASGYKLYAYDNSKKKWTALANVSADTLSYKQSNLKSGTTYKYKVKAFVKQNGKTYWGESSDTMTTTTKPAKPAIKSASTAKTSIKLNWNSVSGATGYRVYRYDTKAKKWVSIGTVKTTAFKDTKLKSKTSYKYAVKAYRKVGGVNYWSSYSTAKSYKTK